MKASDQAKKNNLSYQQRISHELIGELEHCVSQLTYKFLAIREGLDHEIGEHQYLEEKFRNLLELTPQALVIINKQGRIVLANSQTKQLFGYFQEELIDGRIEHLLPERYHEQYHLDQASPPGVCLNLFGLRRDGYEFPLEITLNPQPQIYWPAGDAGAGPVTGGRDSISGHSRPGDEGDRPAAALDEQLDRVYEGRSQNDQSPYC